MVAVTLLVAPAPGGLPIAPADCVRAGTSHTTAGAETMAILPVLPVAKCQSTAYWTAVFHCFWLYGRFYFIQAVTVLSLICLGHSNYNIQASHGKLGVIGQNRGLYSLFRAQLNDIRGDLDAKSAKPQAPYAQVFLSRKRIDRVS